jgi:hypothetical protein
MRVAEQRMLELHIYRVERDVQPIEASHVPFDRKYHRRGIVILLRRGN